MSPNDFGSRAHKGTNLSSAGLTKILSRSARKVTTFSECSKIFNWLEDQGYFYTIQIESLSKKAKNRELQNFEIIQKKWLANQIVLLLVYYTYEPFSGNNTPRINIAPGWTLWWYFGNIISTVFRSSLSVCFFYSIYILTRKCLCLWKKHFSKIYLRIYLK